MGNYNFSYQSYFKNLLNLNSDEQYFVGRVRPSYDEWEVPSATRERNMSGILFHIAGYDWNWSHGCQTIYGDDYDELMEVLGGTKKETWNREKQRTELKWEYNFKKKGKYFLWN